MSRLTTKQRRARRRRREDQDVYRFAAALRRTPEFAVLLASRPFSWSIPKVWEYVP